MDEARNQYNNYIKGNEEGITGLNENETVINTIPKISYEQSEDLDNVRILQTAINNWGDATSGVIKYHIENSRFDVIRQKFIDLDADLGATGDATQSEKFDKKAGEMSLLEMADQQIVYILKSLYQKTKKGTGYVNTTNKLGFKELGNFNQFWKNMVRTLSGITEPKQMYDAIVKASNTYPEFQQLLSKLPNPSLPNNSYENDIITSMWQTFQKPEATLLQLTGFKQEKGSEYPVGSIVTELTNSAVDVANTIREFGNKFKSDTRDSYIERIDNQSMLNTNALIANFSDANGNLDPDKSFRFLNAMGFYLDELKVIKEEINGLQGKKKYGIDYIFNTIKAINYTQNSKVISKAAADIIADFKKDPLATLVKGIPPQTVGPTSSFVYTSGSKQKNSVEKIAGLQVKYGVDASNFTALNPERNLVNKHIDHSSASMIISGFNQATKLEDLGRKEGLEYMSSYSPAVNPFIEELQVTKSLFDLTTSDKARRTSRSLELDLVMGTQVAEFTIEDADGNPITKSIGTNTNSLDGYGKFLQEFHTFFKGGLQEFLRAGSKSTSMGMRINGGIVSEVGERKDPRYYIDLDKFLPEGNAESFAFDNIILPYLSGETERINRYKASSVAKNYTGYNNKLKNGKIAGESFMYFDAIIDNDTKEEILEKVNKPGVKLKEYIKNDPKLYKKVKDQVIKYFGDRSEDIYEFLQNTKYIDKSVMDRLNLPNLSEAEKERILSKAYLYNAWIHNFEVSQIIFGDIAQFKHGKEEFHKRTSGAISGGPKIRTDKAAQDFINDANLRSEKATPWDRNMYAKTLANPADYAKFTYKGTVNTAIIQDVDRDSLYIPQIEKAIRADYEKRYKGRPNAKQEVDTRVDIEVDKYKKMTEGDGQGYITFDAYRTLKKLMNKWDENQELLYRKIVKGEEIKAEDITTYFPVFKLQNYGNLSGTVLPVTAMHKFALMPLIPSVIKGSELETLHHEMLRNNIQYATFVSGSKVGGVTSDGKADDIFTDATQTKIKDTLTLTPNTVYVEYLKESASVPDHYKGKVVFSTQLRKIILAGLYNKGTLVNANNKAVAERYKTAVDNYTNLLKLELLDEINFKQVGDTYKGNIENLLKLIQRELRRKDMPEHLVEAIGLNEDGTLKNDLSIHLDAQTIEKTIMSIVEKRFVKQKLKGEALVQVASSFTKGLWSSGFNFTNATQDEVRNYLGSNTLPFYEPGPDGKTKAMKVAIALQGDFNNLLNKEYKGEKIGTIKRLNELIKDEEWLNTGDNRKAITLSAVRIPVQGLNSMEFSEVYEFLDPAAGSIIIVPSELVAKSGGDYDVDKLTTFFPHIAADGSFVTSTENTADFIKKIESQREKDDKSFAGEIKKQKRAAENEIIDSIRGILEISDNYVNLVRPNDTYILQDISEELENFVSDYDRFVGGSKENKQISPSIVLDPLYNVHKHAVNMEGKDVLGIAANENAISPVFDSIGASMPLTYQPTKWSKKLKRDVEITKGKKYSMRLFLPHNTMDNGSISLSNIYSKDGLNSVSELFSQAINGTVDVEKNPWIFFIQGNLEVANTLFYLFKAGVPVKDAIYFVSNPLVRDYVQNQKSLNSAFGEFTGLAPESKNYVKYNSAELTVNKIVPTLITNGIGDYKGDLVVNLIKGEPVSIKADVLAEEIKKGTAVSLDNIASIEKTSGSPKTRNLYTRPVITNAGYYRSSTAYSSKANVLKGGVYNTSDMENLIKQPGGEASPLAVSMFLHFLEIEKQLKGISALKRISKPDTQTFKSPQEILYRDVNTELISENSKVNPALIESLQNDSILSSLFDKKIIMSMLDPLFKLRDNTPLNNFILRKIRLDSAIIINNFGQGKDGVSRFIDEYKNGLINFIYQNYMSNLIDSNGKIANTPDDYRGHKIVINNSQTNEVSINKNSEGDITSISINQNLINEDYKLQRYLGKNNALDNSYFKRGLKTFKESDLLFPDKSSYLKFILERDYLRDVYKTESGNPGFENFLADRALMNTFNRAAIMRNNEHSYSDKVMGIIKNFPTLKNQFPILEQISRVPSVSGDNILTLNDRRIITGSQAEIYSQNIKQLANPYIKKVEDPTANKAISDVFSLFSQMMIYQHGVGKSKYGFNIALPSDKYNTIMKYASKVFSTNYMNDKTFNIIFDRLTAVKTPFKSYMIDADKLSSYVQPVLTEETEEELVDNDPSEILMEKPETDIEIEIAALRVREQEELQDAIPNIADYPDTYADVQGNMPDNLYAIYKPIYDKYDLLITSASTQPSTNVKADVILPIGTSGSGKSTFIKSLPQENLLVIEPDAMRVEFTGDINNKSKDAEIYIEAANRAIDGIKNGKQVVFDTTNLTKEKRRPFIEAIKKAIPTVNIQYKLMPLDPELAKQRIKAQIARGENRANVSDETIDRHAASYKQMLEDIKSEDISNYDTQPSTQPTEGIDKFAKKNIFTVTPIQAADKKAKIKASIATQYIGFGEGIVGKDGKRSSTQLYREQVGALANTGNYSSDDVIFVSVPGLRGDTTIAKREQDKTIKEAIKAVEAGATILTDNKAYTDANNYNTGEKRLYANMEAKGYNYSEITVDNEVIGTWSKSTQPIAVEETETNLPPAGAQLDMFDNFDASSEELRKQQEEDERKEDEEDNNCTDSPFLD
jgi:predicted kinase